MSAALFSKVLIANRGEIACRVIAACRALGIKTVAVHSQADAGARHVRLADECVEIGPGPAPESYLNAAKLIEACRSTKAQAVHPGYGFLSERASFAKAVIEAGLTWIGPNPDVIDLMGNKIAAKKAAEKAKVPTLPWQLLADQWTVKDLDAAAKKVGYPLLLKAAAGGGGRGMRLVESASELHEKAESAVREAQGAFGSGEIFLESYCGSSRHIEVQVMGDHSGQVLALGERECSVQRRHQKVIEEAPAPNLSEKTRKALWNAAVNLAKAVKYVNAGTCEFLVDEKERFYFLEMNTRLQVEHPVTELVWGIDLPMLQIKVAQGAPLSSCLDLSSLSPRGHAIEARLYAEDPSKGFMPSPGRLSRFSAPHWPHLRVDTGYESGSEVPLFYDAMIAKMIAWGMDREQARQTLQEGLKATIVDGVAWNGHYLLDITKHQKFIDGNVTTQWLGESFSNWKGQVRSTAADETESKLVPTKPGRFASPWQVFGSLGGKTGRRAKRDTHGIEDFSNSEIGESGPLIAEYPGKVLKILVAEGQSVEGGSLVVVCESMKMEFSYTTPIKSKVKAIRVEVGQVVAAGAVLVEWEDIQA